jgi:hypothetical protein
MLCGSAFGLRVERHRLFESNACLMSAGCMHAVHVGGAVGVYGDHWDREGGWLRPDGTSRGRKATSVEDAGDALGIDWMTTWDDLTDAIPPAYTHMTGPTEPSPDVHRTATLLRHLFVALIRVGFEERQALVIVGQAVTAIPSTPSAPTVALNVDDITRWMEDLGRHARAS